METTIINHNWKDLIKPSKLNIQTNKDKSLTTFVAEPLEKGYALTIGNSLRRILLSSIQGYTSQKDRYKEKTTGK